MGQLVVFLGTSVGKVEVIFPCFGEAVALSRSLIPKQKEVLLCKMWSIFTDQGCCVC